MNFITFQIFGLYFNNVYPSLNSMLMFCLNRKIAKGITHLKTINQIHVNYYRCYIIHFN